MFANTRFDVDPAVFYRNSMKDGKSSFNVDFRNDHEP